MTDPADRLDAALARRAAGDRRSEGDLDFLLAALDRLEALRAVPPRSPDAAAAGRRAFLARSSAQHPPVSPAPGSRHTGWLLSFNKERSPMTTLISLVLAVTLALGGAGASAYAAQDSLPAEPLYPVKLATEDLRLAFTGDSASEVELLAELAVRRVQEMVALAESGRPIPPEAQSRLEAQLLRALTIAAEMDDPAPALELLREVADVQARGLPSGVGLESAERALVQARLMAEIGLADPAQLRTLLAAGTVPSARPTRTPRPMQTRTPQPSMTRDVAATTDPGPGRTPMATGMHAPDPSHTPGMTETHRSEPSHTPEMMETRHPDPSRTPWMTSTNEPGPDHTPMMTSTHSPESSATPMMTGTHGPMPGTTPMNQGTPRHGGGHP